MSTSSQPATSNSGLKVLKAIIVGWLVVGIPAIGIILISMLVSFAIEPRIWWLFLSVGFILGWTWWAHSVPRWRQWAQRRGANPDRLQKWAAITLLVWPNGRFEKPQDRFKE